MRMKSKFLMASAALAMMAAPALAQDKLKIGMTFQELNNPYFVSMQEALKEAAASIGADVVVTTLTTMWQSRFPTWKTCCSRRSTSCF